MFQTPGLQTGGRDPLKGHRNVLEGRQKLRKKKETLPLFVEREKKMESNLEYINNLKSF